MSRDFLAVVGVLGLLAGSVALAGSEVRGGGNTVRCVPSADNAFVGLYALDYIVTYQGAQSDAELVPAATVNASLDRIGRLLAAKLPALGRSFAGFSALIDNHSDFTQGRIWLDGPLSPVDIRDQDFIFPPPPNCVSGAPSTTEVIQTITRDPSAGIIKYYANAALLDELRQGRPLQLSFLLVHEWLWDHFDAPAINNSRLVDRLLHSQRAETLSPHDLWVSLSHLGMSPDSLGPDPGGAASVAPTKLAVGDFFSCLLHREEVRCWGIDPAHSGPVPKPALRHPYDLAAASRFVCALDADGVKCWGNFAAPAAVAGLRGARSLVVGGGGNVCIVGANGRVTCGGPIEHELNDTLPDHPDALAVSDFQVCAAWAGQSACFGGGSPSAPLPAGHPGVTALAITEQERCVGDAGGAACVDGQGLTVTLPSAPAVAVVAGDGFVCDRAASGAVACAPFGVPQLPWTVQPTVGNGRGLAASSSHVCALDTGVVCWGDNSWGQTLVPAELTDLGSQ